jgi:cephalosporin hydroxylase
MKSIRELFYEHEGKLIHKWDHYFDIYEKYLSKYRGEKINILEIGISHGGSIQLWKKYFGDNAHIFAIDINPECEKLKEENITIFIGSQSDPVFVTDIIKKMPLLDVIIDDGGHTMVQQKTSFEFLYPRVKDNGLYIVEDTHTSYWHEFHGGYKNSNSFIEYSKNLVDALYDAHIENEPRVKINDITRNINSITFFDSVIIFEKKLREKPFHIQKGTETITPYIDKSLKRESITRKIKMKLFGDKTKNNSFWKNSRGKI